MQMCCGVIDTNVSKDNVSTEFAIGKLETILNESMSKLSLNEPFKAEDSTRIANFVYKSMTKNGRVYHSITHIFDISAGMDDPILILSALFHDVIHYQIDKSFDEEQTKYLEGLLVPNVQEMTLVAEPNDPLVALVVDLYGFVPGAELPKSGRNEFLSGIIGVRILKEWLQLSHLIQIAACIEGTIPFRPTVEGKTVMDRLYDRLASVSKDQTEEWLVDTVRKAAATANFDLCSFDSSDRDFFLDSSWKLIPEARPVLLEESCCLQEYLDELHCLEGRSKFLKGAVTKIFQSYKQVPSDVEMVEKETKAHENLDIMMKYADVRLLQLMILVDFVIAGGEDPKAVTLRPFLQMPVSEATEASDLLTSAEKEIRKWLVQGRHVCFDWDPAISPLGGYLFDAIGMKGVSEAIELGKSQEDGSYALLKYLPKPVIATVSSGLAALFPDQAEHYLKVPIELGIM
jgi:hypothetical protein